MTDQELFPTGTAELMPVRTTRSVRLSDGDHFPLVVTPVRKTLDGADLRMLAYNGSIPGPTLHVQQGATVTVDIRNSGDVETTVHWHGLRLENRYDGVPHETQEPIPVGGGYRSQLQFPDPGVYWYHPHIREDFAQEMGLYGTIVVHPTDPAYWPAVDRELTLTLDDLLVEDGHIAPFSKTGPNYTAMGRFGNVLLINGRRLFGGAAPQGEVVRLYLVNTANTRIFNFVVLGARAKLVGGDSGRYEHETFVDEVLLAPSERAVLDVFLETAGEVRLEHRTPDRAYDLGGFSVSPAATPAGAMGAASSFATLRTDPDLTAERAWLPHHLERSPDKVLAFVSHMPLLYGDLDATATSFACPMHPDVTDTESSTCPECGMRLVAVQPPDTSSYVCPMHPDVTASAPDICLQCGMKLVPFDAVGAPDTAPESDQFPQDPSSEPRSPQPVHEPNNAHSDGLEWEDLMPAINRASDTSNMIWQLIDRDTSAVNDAIDWSFTVGDRVKIQLVNEMVDSDHPMHHPFHIHGAGRFLILARDGEPETNLVWKDTVLLRAGQTIDILLDITNPGLWMAHCHIAEHTESGMMFSFKVAGRPEVFR